MSDEVMTQSLESQPTLLQLQDAMRRDNTTLVVKWFDLGLELLDPSNNVRILNEIKADCKDVNECCRRMFETWLTQQKNPSWNQVITALTRMNLNSAAEKIMADIIGIANTGAVQNQESALPSSQLIVTARKESIDFGILISEILKLLANNETENLEKIKNILPYLTTSHNPDALLLSYEEKEEIDACDSIKVMFTKHLRTRWKHDNFLLLKKVIQSLEVTEHCNEMLEKYEQKLEIETKLQRIHTYYMQKEVSVPHEYDKMVAIVHGKIFHKITWDEYNQLKTFVLQEGRKFLSSDIADLPVEIPAVNIELHIQKEFVQLEVSVPVTFDIKYKFNMNSYKNDSESERDVPTEYSNHREETDSDDYLSVEKVKVEGREWRAGLHKDDCIVHIDGDPCYDMKIKGVKRIQSITITIYLNGKGQHFDDDDDDDDDDNDDDEDDDDVLCTTSINETALVFDHTQLQALTSKAEVIEEFHRARQKGQHDLRPRRQSQQRTLWPSRSRLIPEWRQNTTSTWQHIQSELSAVDDANAGQAPDAHEVDRLLCDADYLSTESDNVPNGMPQRNEQDIYDQLYPVSSPREKFNGYYRKILQKLTESQRTAILDLTDQDRIEAAECCLLGPNLQDILRIMSMKCRRYPPVVAKVNVNAACSDLMFFYATPDIDFSNCFVLIKLTDVSAIDGGGVSRHMYTKVLKQISENCLSFHFIGSPNHLRPYYSAATVNSEIFKVFGCIIGHSIMQEGIGFPYLSPLCYWYIAAGKDEAMRYHTDDDVGADCNYFVTTLKMAATNYEIQVACNTDHGQQLLNSAGVNEIVTLNNKDKVIYSVIMNEAIFKIALLLDQLKEGLKKVKLLDLIQGFPHAFAPLFTFTEEINPDDVLKALHMESDIEDKIAMGFLNHYVCNLSKEKLQSFMICVTGSTNVKEQTIVVKFIPDIEVIHLRTCSKEIYMPYGMFKENEYEMFQLTMDCIIEDTSFNDI